uniref:Plancitoxin-1-like n=1 Tax=Hirondellea gigas TaxID=1518452 RepID=A0A6A7G6G8_9CRUS
MATLSSLLIIAVVLVENSVFAQRPPISCRGPDDELVDWFIIGKTPFTNLMTGRSFVYMDNNHIEFVLAETEIDDKLTPFARTLERVYENSEDPEFAYVMYNDAIPDTITPNDSAKFSKFKEVPESQTQFNHHRLFGHSKGVLAADPFSGFWLSHSVPKFPPRVVDGYSFTSNGIRYAQQMFCQSFTTMSLADIAAQFRWNFPQVYDSHLPEFMETLLPELRQVIDHVPNVTPPGISVIDLTTFGGMKVTNFAKSYIWNQSLYSALISKHLNTNLRVQTWQNGAGGRMISYCQPEYENFVENIVQISLGQDLDGNEFLYNSTQDHSKWAISVDSEDSESQSIGWVCIGDVNRMESQFKRGGGSTCVYHEEIWKAFSQLPFQIEHCA